MRRHPVIWGAILLLSVAFGLFLFVKILGVLGTTKSVLSFSQKIGVVFVEGIITDSREIIDQLEGFGEDDRICAVVVRIESPGGGVVPSQEIHDAILELKKQKRVVASMGSVAASGGYLVACAADRIVASPGTITGSLSAIMHFANVEGLLNKVGLKSFVVKSGKYKDIGSPVRIMTDDERDLLQGVVDDSYAQFFSIVQHSRKIPRDKLMEIADGRIFTGHQAFELGLVDEMGGLNHAVRIASRLAGLKEKARMITPRRKSPGFWEYVMHAMGSAFPGTVLNAGKNMTGLCYLYLP